MGKTCPLILSPELMSAPDTGGLGASSLSELSEGVSFCSFGELGLGKVPVQHTTRDA